MLLIDSNIDQQPFSFYAPLSVVSKDLGASEVTLSSLVILLTHQAVLFRDLQYCQYGGID